MASLDQRTQMAQALLSPEEQALANMSPIDALRLSTELQNRRVYTPQQAAANRQQTILDALYASPIGNALSLRDAMESKWNAQQQEQQGDTEGAKRNYASAAASALMGFLPGMGRIGLGKTANTVAREADTTLPAIMAYHGSPHDFDRFDMSKIGTGEGAQAYGHGLYFATNRKVAREYEGALAKNGNDPAVMAREALYQSGGDPSKALENLRLQQANLDNVAEQWQYSGDPTFGWAADNGRKAIQLMEHHAQTGEKLPSPAKGGLYNVELDVEPHQLLDWDKPLGQQSPAVIDALSKLGVTEESLWPQLRWGPITGEQAWKAVNRRYGPDVAAQALREAGIPGIRYLDQGSRGTEGGTHNIVMFDDNLIKMLGKE